MSKHALQVIFDDRGSYRWVLLAPTNDWNIFTAHSEAGCDFQTFEEALNAGTLALAAACGEPYENEAGDPVGGAAFQGEETTNKQPVHQQFANR